VRRRWRRRWGAGVGATAEALCVVVGPIGSYKSSPCFLWSCGYNEDWEEIAPEPKTKDQSPNNAEWGFACQ
jgi:hypothetical protein